MKDLCPPESETRKMLRRIQSGRTELSTIDCKETLDLKEVGDHASFIRHIAALANTGQRSHLLIGVEDKTWALKGIADDSSLRAIDGTQQQMNQILGSVDI